MTVIIATSLDDIQKYKGESSVVVYPHALVNLTGPFTSFGYTWQERVFPISAIEICVSGNQITSVRNLVDGSYELGTAQAAGNAHLFQLLPNEKIRQVDVFATNSTGINGIRFHTTLRSSACFGSTTSGHRRVFASPEGHGFHCLFGSHARVCRTLGVFYRAVTDTEPSAPETDIIASALLIKRQQDILNEVAFSQKAVDGLRAVVIQSDDTIERIWVLTADQAAKVKSLLNAYEHWIELLEEETITSMDMVAHDTGVAAMRFTTTHRTTPWFGNKIAATAEVVTYTCPEGQRVCGFHGTMGPTDLTSLGVLTTQKPADVAPPASPKETTENDEKGLVDKWDVLNLADYPIIEG
ncbi:hypothetical protein Poli38472_006670 [Pythium oligandrum]|uniref:Jacalin-type lectin domain-containing protein n=1 Tax=Pythium oligandrum TaxID=41045 RepID=A0A8K1C5D0_PYTOL|nr:hypothetical protein Poli38472_006670 [Pythium oligandrum]|eukprot:TMW56660.1 hypothetical protein Poli38472_006670 [Pythium oligandrum]